MKLYISIFYCIFFYTSSFASDVHSVESLKNYIYQYMQKNIPDYQQEDIRISINNIDPRLQLKKCKEDHLQVFNPYATPLANTNTIGIRCTEPESHWTLYVPISIAWFKSVVVSAYTINNGSQLDATNLKFEKMNISQLKQGYYTDLAQLDGLVANRTIPAGGVITPNSLSKEKIIKRGQTVNITAKNEHFSVRMMGEALSDGRLGDIIRIRNKSSKRIIQAKVSGMQQVEVTV